MTTATTEFVAHYEEEIESRGGSAKGRRPQRRNSRRFVKRRRTTGLGIRGRNASRSVGSSFRRALQPAE